MRRIDKEGGIEIMDAEENFAKSKVTFAYFLINTCDCGMIAIIRGYCNLFGETFGNVTNNSDVESRRGKKIWRFHTTDYGNY